MKKSEPSLLSPRPFKPRKYQVEAVKFLLARTNAGLFLDPGLGKTSITLKALSILKERSMLQGAVLIVAPLRACYTVWPREIQKWSDFSGLTYEILHGDRKDEALQRKADIYLINPEGLEWLFQVEWDRSRKYARAYVPPTRLKFLSSFLMNLVVDELSKFKAHDTNRHQLMREVRHIFGRIWGLTGSPAANGLMGLWGQSFLLDGGNALGPYISHYRTQYFIPDRSGYNWTLIPGFEKRIYERLNPLVLRMGEELLDMPDLVINDILVEMPLEHRELYRQLERDMLIALEEDIISAPTVAAAMNKCRQFASGGLYVDAPRLADGRVQPKAKRKTRHVHDHKTEALKDLVEELQGQPLLVAYDFKHDLERLRKAFPKAVFADDLSMAQFSAVEEQWNRGEIPLLFGHPQSIGHGLNLQGSGHHVAWYTLTWDYELYDQFIRRIYRQGQKHSHVYVHRILMEGTIDEVVAGALAFKQGTQQALFDGLKKLRRKL
jgi:SNF2 family DNA or RNA helicase